MKIGCPSCGKPINSSWLFFTNSKECYICPGCVSKLEWNESIDNFNMFFMIGSMVSVTALKQLLSHFGLIGSTTFIQDVTFLVALVFICYSAKPLLNLKKYIKLSHVSTKT